MLSRWRFDQTSEHIAGGKPCVADFFCDESFPAKDACLNHIFEIAAGTDGDIYFLEGQDSILVLRRIPHGDPNAKIETVFSVFSPLPIVGSHTKLMLRSTAQIWFADGSLFLRQNDPTLKELWPVIFRLEHSSAGWQARRIAGGGVKRIAIGEKASVLDLANYKRVPSRSGLLLLNHQTGQYVRFKLDPDGMNYVVVAASNSLPYPPPYDPIAQRDDGTIFTKVTANFSTINLIQSRIGDPTGSERVAARFHPFSKPETAGTPLSQTQFEIWSQFVPIGDNMLLVFMKDVGYFQLIGGPGDELEKLVAEAIKPGSRTESLRDIDHELSKRENLDQARRRDCGDSIGLGASLKRRKAQPPMHSAVNLFDLLPSELLRETERFIFNRQIVTLKARSARNYIDRYRELHSLHRLATVPRTAQ